MNRTTDLPSVERNEGEQTGENDTYAFGLAAHPGQSQGRPAMSTGKPKEQIAACPICVLPRKPQPPGPTTLNPPPDAIAERFRTANSHTGMSRARRYLRVSAGAWRERWSADGEGVGGSWPWGWGDGRGRVEQAPDAAGEVAFEAANRFPFGFAFA